MSLPMSIRTHVGQLLCFLPLYGWGWYRLGVSDDEHWLDYADVDNAGAFHIRIRRIFDFRSEPRGVVGQVEEPKHLFDGLWAATWTMMVGDYDLETQLCQRWDIELGPTEPEGNDWPSSPDTPPAYAGHGGILAVSHSAIRRFRERR